ncbi:partitioning defective 3 homolog B isoform X1 [Ictalurus furcatus]|uniref:partitioning defective 3 homolog B isoform X1 n=1 Tax=Ictalurus furcatus TaxID=66913 RepID=UPI00234FC5BB|nr:partitioning defective 3 homolog B isoform X1 [Ictalurus furcatus]XP_053483216.1 partitioning defective 3 homolog B isoform X1 [Ictalurus furcatus]
MKVTVTFGRTGVVVPCKEGWTVRDLIHQATQRYKKLLEQEGDFLVRTHHVEYCDGGILDPDDVLSDLVEDKDKLIAVYEEQEARRRGTTSPRNSSINMNTNGGGAPGQPSPEPYDAELVCFQPIRGGEIEVNSSVLKSSTPLMVRSSSDSALGPSGENGPAHCETDMDQRSTDVSNSKSSPFTFSLTRTVEISGEHGPLGIHVVPYCSSLSGRALGLHIRSVEENSRSRREGIFQDDDCIVKINDTELMDKSFSQSQEVFRQAMRLPAVRLEVLPMANKERFEKSLIGHLFSTDDHDGTPRPKEPPPLKVKPMVRPAEPSSGRQAGPQESCSVNMESRSLGSPLPISLYPRGKSSSPLLKKSHTISPLVGFTTKKGGKRLKIDLKKGPEGLGFTVVTRDSSVHGPGPILVKNILPRGAAVKDGRLQSGDRILEVNGVDISGRTQEELVAMLRSTKQGDSVSLVVARQEELFLPRELKEEPIRAVLPEEGKEQLMFEVPLNDSGSAGLGVSLKGNKSRETSEDLGIFIKSIIHGGAAYKDGRLRVNDQLLAVNGESLLGKSNHEAMETLRRSMSMEGNLRGMIQLVVLRVLPSSNQEYTDSRRILNRSFDSCVGQSAFLSQSESPVQPHMVMNNVFEQSVVSNEGYGEEIAFSPYRQNGDLNGGLNHQPHQSLEWESGPCSAESSLTSQAPRGMMEHHHIKSSKSMDLVADESKVGCLVGQKSAFSGVELGPTLGLKKSSSLESLQTAVSEAQKNDLLLFHRPRAHMVRGRGCNESFRAAIDKSYDGPAEEDDDEGSEASSGRDTPASSSSRQGLGDNDENKKDKKKKAKGKKKDKLKSKGKDKDKKKAEEATEDPDKKTKKKGFGLLRFGKKKEEKSKGENKASTLKHASELLSEEELQRMKGERERIEAKHQELRDRQARDRFVSPEVDDDDVDPNYARINTFRGRPSQSPYGTRSTSPQRATHPTNHSREPSTEDPLDGLYAKINKPRGPTPHGADSSMDRIQQLRREYQQARRDGAAPAYEELEARRQGSEYDPHRISVRSPDPRMVPRYEDVERQYASLPRRGPVDPTEYPGQAWPGHRDPAHYTTPQPGYHPNYPHRPLDPRHNDPGFYHPHPPQRGPLRQDVPPSPPLPLRGARYDTMNRGGFRHTSPERFAYTDGRHPDPRQKNAMTAAV